MLERKFGREGNKRGVVGVRVGGVYQKKENQKLKNKKKNDADGVMGKIRKRGCLRKKMLEIKK